MMEISSNYLEGSEGSSDERMMETVSSFIRNILIVVSMVITSIYILTVSPSIAGGDSGEIVAEGCQVNLIILTTIR